MLISQKLSLQLLYPPSWAPFLSELATKRVEKVSDVLKEGEEVSVKVVGFDRGKVKLSMKQA